MHVAYSVCVCERERMCVYMYTRGWEREGERDWLGDNTESSYIIFHTEKNSKGK